MGLSRQACLVQVSKSKGQTALEYAVLIAAVVAALLVMQMYLKRGVSGHIRRSADSIGEQYHPRNTTGSMTMTSQSDTTTTVLTLNEPQLSGGVVCVDANKDDQCDCIDLNGDGDCTDERVFGTVTQEDLKSGVTTRKGAELVDALGGDLWN